MLRKNTDVSVLIQALAGELAVNTVEAEQAGEDEQPLL